MGQDLFSSPPWVPFYPYTMFQNPIPKPSFQKSRKTIITQKVLVTQAFKETAKKFHILLILTGKNALKWLE